MTMKVNRKYQLGYVELVEERSPPYYAGFRSGMTILRVGGLDYTNANFRAFELEECEYRVLVALPIVEAEADDSSTESEDELVLNRHPHTRGY